MTADLSKYRRALAEVAGIKAWLKGYPDVDWRPDEDVAQAIQVLEALDLPSQINNTTHNPRRWIVDIWVDQDGCRQEEPILSQAICLAVIAALGLEPDA